MHDYRFCCSVNDVCGLLQFYAAFCVLRSTFYAGLYSKRAQISGLQYRMSIGKYVESVVLFSDWQNLCFLKYVSIYVSGTSQNLKTRVWWGHETSCALGIRKKKDSIRLKKVILYRPLPPTLRKTFMTSHN